MGYLYGVRIRQVEEIFINNREMLSYGKFMCTYRKKKKTKSGGISAMPYR